MGESSTGLYLRCLTCGEEAPCESMSDWGRFIRHGKGHKSRLFDIETREELASAPPQVSKILKERGYIPANEVIEEEEPEQISETDGDINVLTEQLTSVFLNHVGTEPDDETLEDSNQDKEQQILKSGGSVLSPEGMIQHQVTLPPEAYVMYNMAQAWHLSGKDKDQNFNEWVFDCIKCRYEMDYGLELCLTRVVDGQGVQIGNEFIPTPVQP